MLLWVINTCSSSLPIPSILPSKTLCKSYSSRGQIRISSASAILIFVFCGYQAQTQEYSETLPALWIGIGPGDTQGTIWCKGIESANLTQSIELKFVVIIKGGMFAAGCVSRVNNKMMAYLICNLDCITILNDHAQQKRLSFTLMNRSRKNALPYVWSLLQSVWNLRNKRAEDNWAQFLFTCWVGTSIIFLRFLGP